MSVPAVIAAEIMEHPEAALEQFRETLADIGPEGTETESFLGRIPTMSVFAAWHQSVSRLLRIDSC